MSCERAEGPGVRTHLIQHSKPALMIEDPGKHLARLALFSSSEVTADRGLGTIASDGEKAPSEQTLLGQSSGREKTFGWFQLGRMAWQGNLVARR